MQIDLSALPQPIASRIGDSDLTDTSGHSGDRTYRIGGPSPAFLKIGPQGKFARAALLQQYWGDKGLSACVEMYISDEYDYLITTPVRGRDGLTPEYLAEPARLAAAFGASLRALHAHSGEDCPVDLLDNLLAESETRAFQQWHMDMLAPFIGPASAEDALAEVRTHAYLLRCDALCHGDYCLPNIMLDDWQCTGFIDIADGGRGDHHYDIAWGLWTLMFNLKDPSYGEIFLDAYGRDAIDPARLRICALLAAME